MTFNTVIFLFCYCKYMLANSKGPSAQCPIQGILYFRMGALPIVTAEMLDLELG